MNQLAIEFAKPCIVPPADTHQGAILRYLREGGSLTPLEALQKFGCLSLSQRVGELKRAGWPIISEPFKTGRAIVARYRMASA